MQCHSPVRDSMKHRIKKAHSPTKPYEATQDPPPPAPDAMAQIAALQKELLSLKEDMRLMSSSMSEQQPSHCVEPTAEDDPCDTCTI
mmetsp:Transcript_96135/g.158569  ORF Transcript_96135/g.158569 Transcript_96135/m.158569 type:complete len:87 (+) Transcript_96135:2-262(+)